MTKYIGILIASVILMSWSHEYYVSIFTVDHNNDKERLEGSIKVFRDDLEAVLESNSYEPIFMEDTSGTQLINELLSNYLSDVLAVTDNNGISKSIQYLGFENEKDVTFVYFKVDDIKDCHGVTLNITWFLESFSDQINIVHFSNKKENQSEYFTQFDTKKTFNFK